MKIFDWVKLAVEFVLMIAALVALVMTALALDKQAESNNLAAFAAVNEIYTEAKWRLLEALKATPEEKRPKDTPYSRAYWEVIRVNDVVLRLLEKDIVTGPTATILKDEYVLSTFRTLASIECSDDIQARQKAIDKFADLLREEGVEHSERFMREKFKCPDGLS